VVGDLEFAGYLQLGERVRVEGSVRARGSLALAPGGPAQVLLSGALCPHVRMTTSPRVLVVTTGDPYAYPPEEVVLYTVAAQ